MWAGFATRNDPRLENMLVRKDGWADFKRAREVPEIKEAALSWPRGYSFAVAYAYLLIFAAIRALVTKDSWIVEYGKSLSPNFIRANVWTLQGALWISLAYYIFRRRRRAIPLLFATVLAGCISIVVHGIRPSDVILCLPDVAILLYLSNYKHVLREDDVSTSEGTNPTVHQNLVGVLIRERLVAGVAFFTASFCIVWLALRGETLQSADPEKIWEAIGSSVFLATGYAWLIWQAFFHARKGTVVLSCFAALLIGAVLFSLWAH